LSHELLQKGRLSVENLLRAEPGQNHASTYAALLYQELTEEFFSLYALGLARIVEKEHIWNRVLAKFPAQPDCGLHNACARS